MSPLRPVWTQLRPHKPCYKYLYTNGYMYGCSRTLLQLSVYSRIHVWLKALIFHVSNPISGATTCNPFCPSRTNNSIPAGHVHSYPPSMFKQPWEQPESPSEHSFTSEWTKREIILIKMALMAHGYSFIANQG